MGEWSVLTENPIEMSINKTFLYRAILDWNHVNKRTDL